MAIKSIKKEDVERLIKNVQLLQDRVESGEEPWMTVGYARSAVKILLKQLKGEYPIL